MSRSKSPEGVKNKRNPNGMGNIYYNEKTKQYEWRQMIDRDLRVLSSKNIGDLYEKIKIYADLPVVKAKIKTTEWFEKWLKSVESLNKTATYEQYNTIWSQHIKPVIGNKLLKKVKKSDIQDVIVKMNIKIISPATNDSPAKIGLSTWTMKHARKIMHIAFSVALDDKIIFENPVIDIKIPDKQAKPRKTLKMDELKILFSYLKNTRWYWAIRLMLVTGLRRGELLALQWSDIDYKNKCIVIDESDSSGGSGDTKNAKEHYTPLSDLAIYYLGKQKEMLQNEGDAGNPILHNEKLKKLDLVFPSDTGTLLKPDSFNSVLDRINEKAQKGIDEKIKEGKDVKVNSFHVTPHMLRHTFVYMSKGRMSLSELQEALGHDVSTTTLDLYGTMLSDTEKVAKKIDDAFADLDDQLEKIEEKKDGKVVQFRKAK
jgi:integrase